MNAAHTLDDKGGDARRPSRGNFLELVLLMAEYDPILKTHVKRCIDDSKRKTKGGKSGRGSLLTFLSKNFINKLIRIIASVGVDLMLEQVKESGKFSLMVDTTQDVSALNQLAICVRYVLHGKVYERLLCLPTADNSSGDSLFNLIKSQLAEFGLEIANIIGCSFDGASNMSAIYKGLQARLKVVNPLLIFTHCMSHVLNLVVTDSTADSVQAENLFGLIQESACFTNVSYKRMSVWTKEMKKTHSAYGKLRKLHKANTTCWWSKSKALQGIIDFNEPDLKSSKFVSFLNFLLEMATGDFDCDTKFTARTLLEKWSSFDTLFTALVISELFDCTTPVSVFLQSKNLDYLKAWNLVDTLLKEIKQKRNDEKFDSLYRKCVTYAKGLNDLFKDELEFETDFVRKRVPIKKKMPGEKASDESRQLTPYENQSSALQNP